VSIRDPDKFELQIQAYLSGQIGRIRICPLFWHKADIGLCAAHVCF